MIDIGLHDLLQRADALPKLPDTSLRLIRVISDPDSTIEQIVDIIRYDQAVTTQLLRLCNSARFGLSRTIASIDDAVRYVGTVSLMRLVMAAHTRALLGPEQSGYGLRPGALWTHSVAVALACQLVAGRLKIAEQGVLFTAGLLHDIGKIVLNEFVAREYAQIVQLVRSARITFTEAEQRVLGMTHTEVGEIVARRWQLPDPIPGCIRHHHEPAALPGPDSLIDVVHLADVACLLVGVGGGDDGQFYRADEAALGRCGFKTADMEKIAAGVVHELKSVQRLFGVEP